MSSLAIGMGVSAAAGLGGAAMSSHAAGKAADAQAAAADQAAELQHEDAQAALQFQEQEFAQQQANIAPWLRSGSNALGTLDYLMGVGAPPMVSMTNGMVPLSSMLPSRIPSAGGQGGPPMFGTVSTNPNQQAFDPADLALQPSSNTNSFLNTGRFARGGPLNGGMARLSDLSGPIGRGPIQALDANGPLGADGNALAFRNPDIGTFGATGTGATATVPSNTNMVPLSARLPQGVGGFGSLLQGWDKTFQAPTNITEQNDPGFQARLKLGQETLENSAAARGGLLSGNTANAEQQFGQDYASNEYSNVYNRALTEYQQGYNQFQQNQANQFNRLAAMSGMGQVATGQLNSSGTAAAGNVGNILLGSGAQIGQQLNNAAAARGSGYINSANAINYGLSGLGSLSQMVPLYQLLGQRSGGGSSTITIDGLGGGE